MNIYFCGVSGVAIGPLAMIAHDMGHSIAGSDLDSTETDSVYELRSRNVDIEIGQQTADHLHQFHQSKPVDMLVYSSAIPEDHDQLAAARELGITCVKRTELINALINDAGLEMIAVAGTHGKTTTTAMLHWLFDQTNTPVSYSIGSTISWGAMGKYEKGSRYFVYEADEYDRNFLAYHPALSLIVSVDYDHPDTYPSPNDYDQAFLDFVHQSRDVIMFDERFHQIHIADLPDATIIDPDDQRLNAINLAGLHNRQNALIAVEAGMKAGLGSFDQLAAIVSQYPGTGRRFERVEYNIYSDYAHTPEEVAATLQLASEIAGKRPIVAVYQPHQNTRQHDISRSGGYGSSFEQADQLIWLPTYETREDRDLDLISPDQFLADVQHKKGSAALLDSHLADTIMELAEEHVVVCMGAGTIHDWLVHAIKGCE